MSAIASRPVSTANSFYESEGRPSIEHGHVNKTRELARAIGREREGLAPSFRPPSTWTQRSSHHDVVWTGDDGRDEDTNDDQFSDAESWDADTQASSHAANGERDATTSVYGHVRPTSIGSSIFAGRGMKSARRREAPPPLPNLPARHQNNQLLGSDAAGLLSPSAQSMPSPRSDASGFESSSQYSALEAENDRPNDDLADGFDMQTTSNNGRAPLAAEDHPEQPVPSRKSSREPPPIPVKAASRRSQESTPADRISPSRTTVASQTSPPRLADGTLIPKMPPVPTTSEFSLSPRKFKSRRDRSPVLSFDGGAAEEEKMLVELQDKLAADARRISTLGPKVKKNAPAPWELGGEDIASSAGRTSLREQLRPSGETFEKPFSKFRSRPSVDSSHTGGKSPNPAHLPSGLSVSVASLEQEALKEDDVQSLFATQRSRSKSVSNTAVGLLKGLGLAGAAAPASKKSKLTKALRLVGGGGGSGGDERKPPLPELPAAHNFSQAAVSPVTPSGFGSDFEKIRATRNVHASNSGSSVSKSQADLVNMIMSSNSKYRDQACSPPIPSPKHDHVTLPSPRMGGVRGLTYKKDTLSPTDSLSFANEQGGHRLSPLEQSRSRTPPTREMDITRRSTVTSEDIAARTSSLGDEDGLVSIAAEDESTPVGKVTADASAATRGHNGTSPTHHAGMLSTSSSQTSGSLPLPGNIEGVPYKLISLEQAREQARQKQSEWLASSGGSSTNKTSPYLASGDSVHDELGLSRDPSSDGQSSMRIKNKKSGFLMRKLKKEKGVSVELDGVSTFPPSGSSKNLARSSKSPMPSFSVTGLDEESDELKPLASLDQKPALQIRPVSSMFSGFAADFLDASALSEGHLRETSGGSSASSTGLLAPHSPAASSYRPASPVSSEAGRCAPSPASPRKPKLADIRPTPHGTTLPGPTVPGSADSNWSGHGGASGASRLPSLDAATSSSDTQSQGVHSPVHSPLTPSFQHSIHSPVPPQKPDYVDAEALSPPGTPQLTIAEEVRTRAREIEAQIQELSNELHELRIKHVGHGTAPAFRPSEAEGEEARTKVKNCPSCGCGCAEQRRLQSINEAAVLKGISVLDRGRALKPSSNMGKFGGYTNR
ncbi:uncharacterized protein MEPE_02101 [Melanopsichium pennsylvanicum]|uniref:Uncharacterized protein n=2 Tax=Melanopsichium pennsylvanicum TaxID=63383 RepID=A0AAJ4XIS4_9BASI|nr:putative protein [Melanopsichium pennsylvanicum 4]SNX83394.1 uncharacterized protein MEPE_02101 [Melanopsichium pennsylvanicum]